MTVHFRDLSSSPGAVPLTESVEDLTALVSGVRSGESWAVQRLYALMQGGFRVLLQRRLDPDDVDDEVHNSFLIVLDAIQTDHLRDPERLLGFIRTILLRRRMRGAASTRTIQLIEAVSMEHLSAEDPERESAVEERRRWMSDLLRSLAPRYREVLIRFYLHEEAAEEICREMGLTADQFRLLKSRAKARFGEIGRRQASRRPSATLQGQSGAPGQ